ncbi:MAG: amino acid adenylation domain-containing protein, partial [bacterium]|nr:amino acid adenylation domain-containing protein [bacterium]
QRQAEARRLALAEARHPFDLAQGPVLRVRLLRSTTEEHTLLVTVHHIAFDGGSLEVFLHELAALYQACSAGQSSGLPELPVQYADFAAWQRQWVAELRERRLAYWRVELAGLPVLELPCDRPRPAVQSLRATTEPLALPAELGRRLQELSARHGTTLYLTLLAAFQVLLGRTSGQQQLAVGLPVAGRDRPELEGMVGLLTNTLVLRGDLRDDPSFVELLARVRELALGACTHHELPFELLVEELEPERNLSRNPLVQVLFVLRSNPAFVPLRGNPSAPLRELAPGLGLEVTGVATGKALYELTLALEEDQGQLRGVLEYNTDLFDATTLRRMAGHLRILLAGVAAAPERRLGELPWLSEAEVHQLLREWRGSAPAYPREAAVHELFEARAAATPDAVALVFDRCGRPEQVSYGELNRRANRLAHHLRGCGVGAEVCVGLCAERSVEMVVGTLGILKAGGAYVPLDPSYPEERLSFMLGDVQAPVVVLRERLAQYLTAAAANLPELRLVHLDRDLPALCHSTPENPVPAVGAQHLAYVMVTSGSTGVPKGVSVPHRGVVRLVREANYAALGSGEVFLQFAPISFDAATLEIWGPLLNGGRLVIFPPYVPTLQELGAVLERFRVTTLWLTAGLFHQMVDENLEGLSSVRQLLAGGDVLSAGHVRRVLERFPASTLINGYGPTESTTFTCCAPMRTAGEVGDPVSIGRPIANTRVHVLDRRLRPVGAGVPGELCIGGDGLARGYLNRPQLTAEIFQPDPVGELPGERLYRTGDLVRYLPDGRLEFLGRRDFQVKLRGFRIELGEIEAALADHPAVRESAVLAQDDRAGGKRLVAFVVADEEPAPPAAELRGFLLRTLHEYLVPGIYVALESLPLTPNGKVDRAALGRAAPPAPGAGPAEESVAPRTPVEEVVAAIWAEVLDCERIGIDDDFFELGGHSLLATRVVARIRDAFGVRLPLQVLFEAATVGTVAAHLEAARREELVAAAPPLVRVPRDGRLPLSFAQQRLWFLDRYQPQSPVYNLFFAYRLSGPLERSALEDGLNEIVRRHEALRTCLVEAAGAPAAGEPRQVICPPQRFPLPTVELTALAQGGRETELRRLADEAARRPFRLAEGPMVRLGLLRLGEEEHCLLLGIHHVSADGWSMGLFHRELELLYATHASGGAASLPELGIQYADYAVWQREWLRGEVWETQLGYWKQQLEAMHEALELPADRPRPPLQSYRGATHAVALPAGLTAELKVLSRTRGTTLFMTLVAAFKVLLARTTGQRDLTIGSPIANRNRSEIEGLIGFFVNTLLLRTRLDGDPSFRELLGRVREVTLGAYAHQDLPFEKLVEELHPQRELSRQPLFQVMFVLQNTPGPALELPGLSVRELAVDNGTAKFDLTLSLDEDESALSGFFEYNTDLFDRTTVCRLAGHLETVLAGVAGDPERRISELPLLPAAERRQLLGEWSHTPSEGLGAERVHELFAAQAARRPDAVAILSPDRQLSYGELNARAEKLGAYLRSLGVGGPASRPEVLVGLFLERSPEVLVGILAVLKAGGAYLPLDPAYPSERLAFMLEDAGVPLVLTREGLATALSGHRAKLVRLDADQPAICARHRGMPERAGRAEDLAYVIYTSGSTGRPKGVMLAHRGLCELAAAQIRSYELGPQSRVLQFSSLSFDASVFEIFSTLLAGGTLCLGTPEELLPGPALSRLLRRYAVTHWTVVPSALQAMPGEELPALAYLTVAGEACPPELVAQWARQRRFVNAYGPTEATVCASLAPVGDGARHPSEKPPIGRPFAASRLYVLDRHLEPVPIGGPGELYIGGIALARGYLGRPRLTAGRFIPDPWSDERGARLYRSGDLVRFLPTGDLDFLGRIDQQVKVRGFRIELGEVEAALSRQPEVREAAVVVREDQPGNRRLVAYVVPGEGPGLPAGELCTRLGETLPDYMIPASAVFLDSLPLTPSGKVDRAALGRRPPEEIGTGREEGFVAPRTPVEEVMAGIWSRILGHDRFGVYDDFFELGGHSLLATQLVSRIRDLFGVELELRSLFQAPTVAELAERTERARRAGRTFATPPLERRGGDRDAVPLSFAQQRLW